ncbi:MAG: hypothetical protein AABZ08_00130 [Planctomycetota bacterium]
MTHLRFAHLLRPLTMKTRLRWKHVTLATLGAMLIVLCSASYTLLRTPGWYDIPDIVPAARQDVRNNLLSAEQAFTENVRTSRQPFLYHVYQDDVNRWIAMRREIYPLIDELAPPELADPMVLFEPGEITLAGRYRKAGMDVVVSLDVNVKYEADSIVLRAKSLRCGSMRVPIDFVALGLNRPIERKAGAVWPGSPAMHGDFLTGLRIDSRATWKNGNFGYRVLNVTVLNGRIDFKIEPLGHQPPKRINDQD